MRNFDYLQELGLTDLHRFCAAAEEMQLSNPDLSAISARKALEYVVRSLYVTKNIEIPERASLFELVDGEPFQSFINDDRVDATSIAYPSYTLQDILSITPVF